MPERERIAIDTSPWIALLDDEPNRGEHVQRVLERAERREVQIFVSTVTITEVVKGPKAADPVMSEPQERTFNDYMDNPFVTLVSVDPVVAARARDLRREIPRLKSADAIVLATALIANAAVLYTYDDGDLLKLDGHPAVGGLRIQIPPIDHALTMWELVEAAEAASDANRDA